MTPAPQPQQEYIITEEQIVKIGEAMTKWYLPDAAVSLCFLLRSRPHAPAPQPPHSAYELYMEARIKRGDVSMWFINDVCPVCNKPVYTDGMTFWCDEGCKNNGTWQGIYSKLQEDSIR